MLTIFFFLFFICRWNMTELKLGAISQPYRMGVEIVVPSNGSIAIDDIRLDDCFPGNSIAILIFSHFIG